MKKNIKKMIKKGIRFSVCAVLAGGIASASFEAVNVLTGWNQSVNVQAAQDIEMVLLKNKEDGEKNKGSLDVSDIVEAAMPSVVSITTKSLQEVQDYYGFFGYGYLPEYTEKEVEGSGSGIIIGKNEEMLLIATNYHVIEGANTVSVSFVDGTSCEAQVRGYDDEKDLAVVAVKIENLETKTVEAIAIAAVGSSDDLKVGEQVVAIGNALGYGQSVTTGIVSAKNRRMDGTSFTTDEEKSRHGVNLIQTDAAINPGNSGGALLNMNGELVGINSAKLASTDIEGMGYAIAISDVEDILENLMNETPREKIEDGNHGVLGIVGSTVSAEANQIYGIPEGVFISEVTEGGAAEKAGIRSNMVLTYFEGKAISTIEKLIERLEYYAPGEEVEVVVAIQNGDGYKEETITVVLGEPEKTTTSGSAKEKKDGLGEEDSQETPSDPWGFGDDEIPGLEDFIMQW